MRAVVFGALASVLALGSARAAKEDARLGCKLDGLELVAEAAGNPTFDQKRFIVTRVMSVFHRTQSPKLNDFKADGIVVAQIEGDAGKYVIQETYSGYGMPQDVGYSFEAGAKDAPQPNPKRRSQRGEKSRVNGVFHIFHGPLEDVSLYPVACK